MKLKNSILAISACIILAACSKVPTFRDDSVWNLYDVRTPVPAGSRVNSRAISQDPANARSPSLNGFPRDYDSYYVPPTGGAFGVCGEGNVGSFNCD